MQCIKAASKGLEAAIEAAKVHTVDALILNSVDARWAGWVCSTAAPPHSENVTTRVKMPYTLPPFINISPFRYYFKWNTSYRCMSTQFRV